MSRAGQLVSARELAAALAAPGAPAVLDATHVLDKPARDGDYRGRSGLPEWLDGHVPTSRHVDLRSRFVDPAGTTHFAHPAPQAVADDLAALGVDEGRPVVVYDRGGTIWAARLWWLLRWVGVDVRVLDGGWSAWVGAGLPVERGSAGEQVPAPRWRAGARRPAWATADEVARPAPGRVLVCGLPADQFDGSAPTRYSRRGHIPGSVSVPARRLFDEAGLLRVPDEVDAIHRAAGLDRAGEVVVYCGGGIAAAANALVLVERGIDAVRLYDGSIEEWSRDPARPLVVA